MWHWTVIQNTVNGSLNKLRFFLYIASLVVDSCEFNASGTWMLASLWFFWDTPSVFQHGSYRSRNHISLQGEEEMPGMTNLAKEIKAFLQDLRDISADIS